MPSKLAARILAALLRRAKRAQERFAVYLRERTFPLRVRHVAGPRRVGAGVGEAVVVCLVRDGAAFLEPFLAHYRSLGACHVVFLDNGSTDGTVARAASEPGVTVLRTAAPYRHYKRIAKRYLVRRFGRRGWVLCVDIDEFFDYPHREQVPLAALLCYLNAHGYSAVVAQMLDLFPPGDLRDAGAVERERHRLYDLATLRRVPLAEGKQYARDGVTPSNPRIERHYGGARAARFGVNACLTKHPLLCPPAGARLLTSHDVAHAHVADFSAVLLHYKYLGDFAGYARRIAAEGSFYQGSEEYKRYVEVLDGEEPVRLGGSGTQEFHSVNRLVAEGFLVTSEAFERNACAAGHSPASRG